MSSPHKILLCFLGLVPVFQGCNYPSRLNFDRGIIPEDPRNMTEVNSIYDDFNSTIRETRARGDFDLVFSTNRMSHGGQYDLISYHCDLFVDLMDLNPEFYAYQDDAGVIFTCTDSLGNFHVCQLDQINSSFNELGPYALFSETGEFTIDPGNQGGSFSKIETHKRFFYANDSSGTLDIFCYYYHEYYRENRILTGHRDLSGINSPFNDAYPSIMTGPAGKETLYFTSDRNGDFDIFAAIPLDHDLVDQATSFDILRVQSLSSGADDKCPYIAGNLMVFTSNREGGYGGFDLYCSVFDGNNWSEPTNFGPLINTQYDEYRPVFLPMNEEEFLSDLMIFSSNRPEGHGGFDLYYAGVNK
jgi:hypothetical protein